MEGDGMENAEGELLQGNEETSHGWAKDPRGWVSSCWWFSIDFLFV